MASRQRDKLKGGQKAAAPQKPGAGSAPPGQVPRHGPRMGLAATRLALRTAASGVKSDRKLCDAPTKLLTEERTRSSLPRRLRDTRDNRSWQEFFDRYWKLIFSTALRAGLTYSEAEEVVQETIVTAARNIGKLDYKPESGLFRGWLLSTTRWKIRDQLRKRLQARKTQQACEQLAAAGAAQTPWTEIEALWDREWEAQIVESALQLLKRRISARQYQAFDLHVMKEWPAGKVADLLGVSRGYVFLVKHRALQLLRKELGQIEKGEVRCRGKR